MIPLFLAGWFLKYRWLKPLLIIAAIVGAVGLIAWGGATVKGWHDSHVELAIVKPKLKAFEDAQDAANKAVLKQAPIDEAERQKLAADRAALEAEKVEVARAWSRINAFEETPDVETGCPVIRLSDAWGVCFAAAAAGDPADVAACEAAGGDGPVAGEPGS